MKKEKFVLIDSNIYIHLCFLDLEFNSDDVLEKINKLLNANKFKLLLPEIIELEFERKFNEKIELINNEANDLVTIIQKSNTIGSKKAKDNLTKSIQQGKETTLKEIQKIKKDVRSIFEHPNTIRDDLRLTPEALTQAYCMFLKGSKPYKKSTGEKKNYENIQPDCLIIASVVKYLENKKDYELFFSTGNIFDFTENPKIKNRDDLILATSIQTLFKDVSYYFDPLKMLNKNFSAGYKKQTIEQFEEKRNQSSGVFSVDYENALVSLQSANPIILNNSPAVLKTTDLRNSIMNTDIRLSESFQTVNPISISARSCRNCLRAYVYSPTSVFADNGLCDNCKNGGLTSMRLSP